MEAKNTDHAPAEVIPVTKDNAERELTALGARLRWWYQKQGRRSPTGPPPFALPSSSALVSTPSRACQLGAWCCGLLASGASEPASTPPGCVTGWHHRLRPLPPAGHPRPVPSRSSSPFWPHSWPGPTALAPSKQDS